MAWTFILADLHGEPVGELFAAGNRSIRRPINGGATASFSIRNDHPLGDQVLDGDRMLKVYEGTVLRFLGDIVTAEEVIAADTMSIAVNCADGLWRAGKRLVGKAAAGVNYGTGLSMLDRGVIVSQALATIHDGGDTGIRESITASSLTYAGPWIYKPFSEVITELGATLDGYDWRFDPVEPVADGIGTKLWTLLIAPSIGIDRPEAIFEYGFGKANVVSVQRAMSRDGLANAAYALDPAGLENAIGASDAASITARGLYEAVVDNDLASVDLRDRLVRDTVDVRKQARQIISLTPHQQAGYAFGTDFDIGDVVRVRSKVTIDGVPTPRLNVAARVYAVQWDIDANDRTDMTIETVPS